VLDPTRFLAGTDIYNFDNSNADDFFSNHNQLLFSLVADHGRRDRSIRDAGSLVLMEKQRNPEIEISLTLRPILES